MLVLLNTALHGVAQSLAETAINALKSPRGVCAILGGDAELALNVVNGSELLVFVQLADRNAVDALKQAAQDQGLLNTRLYVEKGGAATCFLAGNSVDLLICADGTTPAAEIMRVVAPLGAAVIAAATTLKLEGATHAGGAVLWRKPFPKEMDNWSHWYHGPDNNPVSTDAVLQWPFHLQWLGKPYFGSQPRTTIIHNGIAYSATGSADGGHQAVAEMILNANLLEARSAFNGHVLWQRKLPKNYYTSRAAFVATDDAFYMIDDGKGVLVLDPSTGKEIKTLTVKGAPPNYKWIAVKDSVLFVLAGDADLHPQQSGYLLLYKYPAPLISIFTGGTAQNIWGFGHVVGALDLKSGETLWTHKQAALISSRFMAVADGRLYYAGNAAAPTALDLVTGTVLWTNNAPDVMQALSSFNQDNMKTSLGNTRPGLLATPAALVFQTVELGQCLSLASASGKLLWLAQAGKRSLNHPVYLDGKLYAVAAGLAPVNPATGTVTPATMKGGDGCGPITVSPNGLYRRHSIFWDRRRNKAVNDHTFRSGCWQDAIPAHGLLFNTPYVCGCNYSLQGLIVQCPAGDFIFGQKAVERERRELGQAAAGALHVTATDWFTHRANNKRTAFVGVTVPESAGTELWSYKPAQKLAPTAPVAVAGYVFFADDAGRVTCLDARCGTQRWRYATGGKIFFAPTIMDGRVFVSSSDGYVYSLNADTGGLIWRFRCAPQERRIMVYGLLSSTWPANTGVLAQDGVVYAGAGLTSQGGTHMYALDAPTGKIIWQNNESGHVDKENLAGAAVAGCCTISQNQLWLASGNAAAPMAYNLKTGAHTPPAQVAKVVSAKWQHARGNEVANCADAYILTGGRSLFSEQPRRDVKAGLDVSFVPFTPQNGILSYPEITPTSGRQTLPVWDAQQMFIPITARTMIEAWDLPKTIAHFQSIATKFVPNPKQKDVKSVYEPLGLIRQLIRTEYPMKQWGPLEVTADAMALAHNALVIVNQKAPGGRAKGRPSDKNKKGVVGAQAPPDLPSGEWYLSIYSRTDGTLKWEVKLPSEPVDGGLCLDRIGRVIVTFLDGSVMAYGNKESAPASSTPADKNMAVLTVGASFWSAGGHSDKVLKAMLAARGYKVETDSTRGGPNAFHLFNLFNEGRASELSAPRERTAQSRQQATKDVRSCLASVKARQWDYICFMAHSSDPFQTNAIEKARAYLAQLKKDMPAKTKLVATMTWVKVPGKQDYETIRTYYRSVAKEHGILLAPSGDAFEIVERERPDLPIFRSHLEVFKKKNPGKIDRHPSVYGQYLNSCVVFAVITGESPVGLPCKFPGLVDDFVDQEGAGLGTPMDIAPAVANYLQATAWKVAQASPLK